MTKSLIVGVPIKTREEGGGHTRKCRNDSLDFSSLRKIFSILILLNGLGALNMLVFWLCLCYHPCGSCGVLDTWRQYRQ